MKLKIEQLKKTILQEIKQAQNGQVLDSIRQKYLARKNGVITKILRGIKDLPVNERPLIGALTNKMKIIIEEEIRKKSQYFKSLLLNKNEFFDYTLPGKKTELGHLHPLTQVKDNISNIFYSMGFEFVETPEVETDYYNFEALNIPKEHPARDMWDTFWLKPLLKNKTKFLLRTHTTPVDVRIMENRKPPLKIFTIGKCFRHEATDSSHEHTLYQVEGCVVDKNITIANLIYTLNDFLNILFERKVKIRLRPSYFPFTEPSFEIDVKMANGNWLEILGCGMIHPKIYEAVGYPKGAYTGFAFGAGLDRLTMIKYKINDIRWLHSGDLRFIRQF